MTVFNKDNKFDIQLAEANENENALYQRLTGAKIELKSEKYQWARTRNIAVEYKSYGKPSGIAATQADYWAHELQTDTGKTICYIMTPVEMLKTYARMRVAEKRIAKGGDNGASKMVLLSLEDMMAYFIEYAKQN